MNEDTVKVFVPGRLCILGEHSDWAASYRTVNPNIEKGYAVVAGLDLGVYLTAKKSDRFSYQYQDKFISLTLEELKRYRKKDFFEYVISCAKLMSSQFDVGGIEICCTQMTLPIKKGLASSAAICVGIIRIYNLIYHLGLSVEMEMEFAYQAEQNVGSLCGKMDQLCAYGKGLRLVEFDGSTIKVSPLKVYDEFIMVVVNLNGVKDTKKILADLNAHYPFPTDKKVQGLFDFLGNENKNYVIETVEAISNIDRIRLGKLLNNYQKKFDSEVACYSNELVAPLLHRLMSKILEVEGVLGCKGVGSQGDGMAQILVANCYTAELIKKFIDKEFGYDSYHVVIGEKTLDAIIPIAGKGTRLLPYTQIADKAFLPVVHNYRLVPALFLILQELQASQCISNVNLIIKETQTEMYYAIKKLISNENFDIKLLKDYQVKTGFGGAIASSRFINSNGYSLVCLGDYIYKGTTIGDCTKQLYNIWNDYNECVVGIQRISMEDIPNHGVVCGTWVTDRVLKIDIIIEKPDIEFAKKYLLLEYDGKKEVFAFFGQYIVKNEILRTIKLSENSNEVGLSEYLNEYAKSNVLYGYVVDGKSFDIGTPKSYYESFVEYGKE